MALPYSFKRSLEFDARNRRCDSKFQDTCRALCQVFVYVSLARAILIASGLVLLGIILLTLHFLRPQHSIQDGTTGQNVNQTALSISSSRSTLNSHAGKESAAMVWPLASSIAVFGLALRLGRKYHIFPQQHSLRCLTAYFGLPSRWYVCVCSICMFVHVVYTRTHTYTLTHTYTPSHIYIRSE